MRTRIVATLGPATDAPATIAQLIDAGVGVFRLNFSHGTHEEHGRRIAWIRAAAGDRPVAILQDLGGQKLRLAAPVAGEPGDVVAIALPESVEAGDPVLLADGAMQLEVIDPGRARVVRGGAVPAGKGINLPASRLDLPAVTPKDERDLAFGVAAGVDVVALSFVGRPEDLAPVEAAGVPVFAKIERARALEHLEAIVTRAAGVLVARGDLGVEIPIERVPVVQKRLIRLANAAAKPVITATQMLRSMVASALPTRAEAADVANAVLDGTDAVMLSEETAVGAYPLEAVRVMRRIAAEVEPLVRAPAEAGSHALQESLAATACTLAADLGARAIVVATQSGFTARQVARHRPPVPIVAFTPSEAVRRQLSLVWGIDVAARAAYDDASRFLAEVGERARATGLVRAGDPIVVTAGWPFAQPGVTNLVHVATA